MPPQNLQHRRTHHLLLISKLLNLRDNASPFTLVLDTLEQSGRPLVREFIGRAKTSKSRVVYISFETLRKPPDVDIFIKARGKTPAALQKEISSAGSGTQKTLLIIDTLHPLATHSTPTLPLPTFLSALITPSTSLLATYHLDIPLALSAHTPPSPYAPHPLTLLKYLCTTLLTVNSLSQILSRKAAADKSLAEPVFGLGEEVEGVVKGMGGNDGRDVVVEMEYRRKSGRAVGEWFFLPTAECDGAGVAKLGRERVVLLEDYPLYRRVPAEYDDDTGGGGGVEDSTFDLGLTEKQRRDRDGVVLPYFDAQGSEGGVGGRILYDMGEEDDFDEEEDEI
ncbi:MAG: hypothetical protein M1830_003703 [Pleopsidium flavum]|nr:MAG: hypothetical protein M1830_003703 [Pleopsidium flavum]